MLRNYIKSTFRFLKRNKLFACINIMGLSLALAVSFIILLFVINEFSYDRHYKKRKQIYRVLNTYEEFKTTQPGSPYILTTTLKEDFPQIEYAVRTRNVRGFRLKMKDEFIPVRRAVATESDIFSIFDIPLNTSTEGILDDPNSIVLSKKQAEIFFPGENPVGKEVLAMIDNQEQLLMVKGVFNNLPTNSTLQADCFVNSKWTLGPINKAFEITNADVNWDMNFWTNWVLLKKGTDPGSVEARFRELEKENIGDAPIYSYSLQNLADVHLRSDNIINSGITGNIKDIRIFSTIAFLIILVAAFNYIILSTAVSSGRSKEIGIRKTNGAAVKSIKKQLLGESLILSLLVLPIAIAIALFAKPYAEKLFQTDLYIIHSNIIIYISIYLLLTLIIGFLSGIYTSSYLSRLNVVNILKSNHFSGKKRSFIRVSLIVIQLVIFCSFISGTLIIRSQYQFALKKDLGFHNSNILLVDLGRNYKDYRAFTNSIQSFPDVKMAAGTAEAIPSVNSGTMMIPNFQDQSQYVKVEGLSVDYNFIEAMGIPVLKGRSFSEKFGSDLTGSIILNETAVRELGIENPVGKQIMGQTIIGVVKDFNLHSIHSDIPPLLLDITDEYISQVVINYAPGTLNDLLPKLENEWEKIAPDCSFQYLTIENLIKNIYFYEKNLSIIFSVFALFSLLITASGLFGLTLYITKTRTKEIGVKKVLGSSSKAIIYSFIRENLIMVLIASVLAVPVSWYFSEKWLSNFSYKVSISFWYFIIAFVLASVVVLITILFHTYKTSRINPVEALRYE